MVLYGIVMVTAVFGIAALVEYCSARRNKVLIGVFHRDAVWSGVILAAGSSSHAPPTTTTQSALKES